MTIARASVVVAFAVVGWAICAAAIGIGFSVTTERGAFILHAIVAPLAFAGLSWLYFSHIAYTRPLVTAVTFVAIVVVLDAFVVALLIARSAAMFTSFLGTWLPLFLIFAATWATGVTVERQKLSSQ